MRGAVVGMEDGDVKVEGSVGHGVHDEAGWSALSLGNILRQWRKLSPRSCRCKPV